MAASYWYVGKSDIRRITAAQWAAIGITSADTQWDSGNQWSILSSSLATAVKTYLDTQSDFQLSASGGPAPRPVVVNNLDPYPQYLLPSEGDARYALAGAGGVGVSAHSALTGLGNDDHTQYHNDTRGDIRYYTKSGADARYVRTINSVAPDGAGNVNTPGGGGGGAVASVNGLTGTVVLTAADVSAVPTTRTVSTSGGILGGGALSGSLTLSLDYAASGVVSTSKPVRADDSRLSNSRTPTSHAASHATGGTDPLLASDIGAADLAEIVAARGTSPSLQAQMYAMQALGFTVYVQNNPTDAIVRPPKAGFVFWVVYSDPGDQKAPFDFIAKRTVTGGVPIGGGGGGTTTLIYGWDPSLWTSPPDITGFFVDAASTGVPTGTGTLTLISGDYTTTSTNQQIDKLQITGRLLLAHTGVKVKRCIIRLGIHRSGSFNSTNGDHTLSVWGCEIGNPTPGIDSAVGVTTSFLEIKRCNIFGFTDLIHWSNSTGSHPSTQTLIQDNFLHDCQIAWDSFFGGTTTTKYANSHSDCIQLDGSLFGNVMIKHNTLYCWGVLTAPLVANTAYTAETCSATSGPHWFESTHSSSLTDGTTTSGVILNNGLAGSQITITLNRIIGHANVYLNVGNDVTSVVMTNNRLGDQLVSGHYRAGNNGGSTSNYTYTGNVDDATGNPLLITSQ